MRRLNIFYSISSDVLFMKASVGLEAAVKFNIIYTRAFIDEARPHYIKK